MMAYLLPFDTSALPGRRTDVLIVGSGVAGLTAALNLPSKIKIIVASKTAISETNTRYAQGGVAAALSEQDSVEFHEADTLRAGAGLCDAAAVKVLAEDGPRAVEWLLELGVKFDRRGGQIHLTREGAHTQNRVLHAEGDATGRVIQRGLEAQAAKRRNIVWHPDAFLVDLLLHRGRVCGGLFMDLREGLTVIWAARTILATGGFARLYRESTNPPVNTGDGIASAWRAGASLADLEFVQFHPTTLYVAGAPRFLISEAARGEGARLLNRDGRRFMIRYHADGDLAPRDVVARGITEEMARTEAPNVYLDMRPLGRRVAQRFPTICAVLASYGLDPRRAPIPIRPAAHYTMGGVVTDLDGRTAVPGLLAAGETAMTGIHGANRLASNSLLEGLVFGRRAALAIAHDRFLPPPRRMIFRAPEPVVRPVPVDIEDVRMSLRSLMSRNVGVVRSEESLSEAQDKIGFWSRYVLVRRERRVAALELQNMLSLADQLVRSALARRESRGAHTRSDYPDINDRQFRKHTRIKQGQLAFIS